ncbi:MAG: DUF1330 domain-containing protein [Marinilabiliales bacterium]|nr:MAG: DUF1330 domain-containing protein [Marinilabiliales bacterium]
MAAYVIVDVKITDPGEYEEYKKHTPAAVKAYGGKFLARGGRVQNLEGDWNPERIVVLEFPSVERAREWWESDQYTFAREIRQRAATTGMIIVEGV